MNKRLTAEQVRAIRTAYESAPYCTQAQLAEQYRVSQTTISAIISRKTWRHLDD